MKSDVAFEFKANWNNIVSTEATINAQKVVVEASQKITLKVGGNFVVVDSAGVWIKGSMVQINSGGSPDSTSNVTITEPLDAMLADPGEPPNWLALQPPGGRGGRRTHTAVAKHGISLTPRPDGTWQYTPGVIIKSTDPAYVDAVASDLARINDTESDKQLLANIGATNLATERTVTIQKAANVNGTGTGAAQPQNRTNGVGTSSTVNYDPVHWPQPSTRTKAPSDVVLFHEMTHADHNGSGTNQRNNTTKGTPANGYDNDEEFNTIQNENTYRDERGLGLAGLRTIIAPTIPGPIPEAIAEEGPRRSGHADSRDGITIACTSSREGDTILFKYSLANAGREAVFAADAWTVTDAQAGTVVADPSVVTVWRAQNGYAHVLKGVAPLREAFDVPGRVMPLMARLGPGERIERTLVLALPLAEQSDYYPIGPVSEYRVTEIEGVRLSVDVLASTPPEFVAAAVPFAEGLFDIGVRGTLPLLRRVICSFRAKGLHLMVRTDDFPRPD